MNYQRKASAKTKHPLGEEPALRLSYEQITLQNPKKEPLTPSVLKSIEGFADLSAEEAESVCRISLSFAEILLEFVASKNDHCIDNQHVVDLKSENATPVIALPNVKRNTSKNKAA